MGGATAVSSHTLIHGVCRRGRSRVRSRFSLSSPFCSFPRSSLCDFFGAHLIVLGQAWAEGKGGERGGLQRAAFARTADGKPRHGLSR